MKFIRKFNEMNNISIEEVWLKNTGRNINQEEYSAMEEIINSDKSIEEVWFDNTGRNINHEEYSAMEEYSNIK